MECWELFDRQERPVGKRIRRGEPIPPGRYHKIIGVWSVHQELKKILVTRRAFSKVICPGKWENTGGSILCGESERDGAAREVREETGQPCQAQDLEPIARLYTPTAIVHTYSYLTHIAPNGITLQPKETIDYCWVTLVELEELIASHAFAEPEIRQYMASRDHLHRVIKSLDTCTKTK